MFLVKFWDMNDRERIINLRGKVISSRPKLTIQINSVFKHIIKRTLKRLFVEVN